MNVRVALGWRAVPVAAAVFAGCIHLDTADQVHDLRLLAMRADPPEILLLNRRLEEWVPQPIAITGLVADPNGAGRTIHYLFATCAKVDSDAQRCLPTSSDYQVLEEADFIPDQGTGEVSVRFTPSVDLLRHARQQDDFHGFGGLPLPVQLTLTAGGEVAVGYKRVVFSVLFDANQKANQNPRLRAIWLNGQAWSSDAAAALTPGENTIVPKPDDELRQQKENYYRPAFDGTLIHLKEVWRYSFFATSGSFNRATSGGTSNFTGQTASPDNTWKPDTSFHGTVTFWIVVRDGRGGENWEIRRGQSP